jgi:two-component system OmpR family sensor kinase
MDALLENAVQHTGPGDVIRFSVLLGSPNESMVIEDTGAGIPRSEIARIFDRFAAGSSATGHRGTGLGLALVRAIARGARRGGPGAQCTRRGK